MSSRTYLSIKRPRGIKVQAARAPDNLSQRIYYSKETCFGLTMRIGKISLLTDDVDLCDSESKRRHCGALAGSKLSLTGKATNQAEETSAAVYVGIS